jgi:hypothetical protein
MPTGCPCGCGRKIEIATRDFAVGVVRADALLAIARRVLQRGSPERDPAMIAQFRTLVADGERIRGWFLEHVHGEAQPDVTPDLPTLTGHLNEFAAMVRDRLPVSA